MRKYLIFVCLFVLIIIPILYNSFYVHPLCFKNSTIDSNSFLFAVIPPEHSKEELYQDIIMTLINPYIDKAIHEHYGQKHSYDLFGVEVLEARRTTEYRGFTFIMKIHIMPFIGAHNRIGEDNVIIRISPIKTFVEKFEHIKDYEPPPYF